MRAQQVGISLHAPAWQLCVLSTARGIHWHRSALLASGMRAALVPGPAPSVAALLAALANSIDSSDGDLLLATGCILYFISRGEP